MRISTRGRYGLRAIFELARNPGQAPLLMNTLAERQGLSRMYLHALLTKLKAAGLVRSVRGAGGGFVLARPPAEIRLSEVLGVLEGPLSLVDCVTDGRTCDQAEHCPTRRVWEQLAGAIEDVLDHVTLEDLVAPGGNSCSPPKRTRTGRRSPANGQNSKLPRTARTRRRNASKR